MPPAHNEKGAGMSKKTLITAFVMILLLITALAGSAAADQNIVIGQNGIYDLASAVNAIGDNAGNVTIYLNSSVNLNSQIELPTGKKGLNSVTIASYTGAPVTVSMGGSVICANGVPLTIEQGVSLNNGFLVGGKCAAQYGQNQSVSESVLVINGNADYVIGGGLAMGYGAVSTVKITNIILRGNANVVHGGGYAYNGGTADVSTRTDVYLLHGSSVTNAAYGGGYAVGYGSYAPVRACHTKALGTTGKLSAKAGLAENGGNAAVGTYSLQPKAAPTAVPTATPLPYWGGGWYPQPAPQIPQQPVQTTPSTIMYIGPNQQAQNFTDAVNLLPANAGNVVFQLTGNFAQNADVEIPRNRGIVSLTVTSNSGTVTVTWPEDIGFFANGIPTTFTNSVRFSNGTIYGGANTGTGQQSNLASTYLDIAASVNKVVAGSKAKGSASSAHVTNATLIFRGKASGWLYAGGSALYGGYSAVDGTATLQLMQGASVEQSVSGGGFSFGSGSQSLVRDTYMEISGSVIYAAFLGGYADQSGQATTSGQAYLYLQPMGNIGQSVWYGGRAYANANVYVDTAWAQISGRVGATVHKEGRASDNGTSTVRTIR